mmetsp:Transcript_2439/g.5131  ORF Transcript_2439/g.5131 Transcript_2439/m.5131 type:complete len:82 (-) Transcript_2439:10975-11220(-)
MYSSCIHPSVRCTLRPHQRTPSYSWGDLVQAGMKESAQALGYSRNIWNNCLEDVCIEGVEDQDWADLATGVQTAAGAFGCE